LRRCHPKTGTNSQKSTVDTAGINTPAVALSSTTREADPRWPQLLQQEKEC
jgi:hypothetical protein